MFGDFDGNRRVDALDIDALCAAIRAGSQELRYDLTTDGEVALSDLDWLIEQVLKTSLGDANLDGIVNSADLVTIFQAGQYEDAVSGNSGWAQGDWDCDGDFTSQDLVLLFQIGVYQAAAVDGAVPTELVAAALASGSSNSSSRQWKSAWVETTESFDIMIEAFENRETKTKRGTL